MSDIPIPLSVYTAEISSRDRRIVNLEEQLKERETLHTAKKIRYMMEVQEEKARPTHINERVWKFQNSREEKWNIIFAIRRDELHPWVRTFLDCLQNCCTRTNQNLIESQEIVKIIFK